MKKIVTASLLIFILSFNIYSSITNYFSSIYQNLLNGNPYGLVVYEDGTFEKGVDFAEFIQLPSNPLVVGEKEDVLFVGSAQNGELLKIEGTKVEKFTTFEEPMISSLAVSKDNIFVGTSPNGKIYEVNQKGEKKLIKSLECDLITFIIVVDGGDLLVGTGSNGTLYLISRNGEIKREIKFDAKVVRCALKDKKIFVGTSSPASIYFLDENLNPTLINSFDYEEISDIALYKENIYFSLNPKNEESREFKIYELSSKGSLREICSEKGIITSIRSSENGLYFASNRGAIFFYNGEKVGISRRFSRAISSMTKGNSFYIFFSSPPSFTLSTRSEKRFYISPPIDCGGISKLGSIRFEGNNILIFLRGGNKIPVDTGWSRWFSSSQILDIPPFRYYQWKIEFGDKMGNFRGITIAAKQINRPPQFVKVEVHPPGEIYVKNVSQIGDHLVGEIHQKEKPFPEIGQSRQYDTTYQTYYLFGYRMISFDIQDPDGDIVKTKIEIYPENSSKGVILSDGVDGNFFVFDARTLPDGIYRLVLTASDIKSNSEGDAKYAVCEIPYFEVDNNPPEITMTQQNDTLIFKVKDATSIRSARICRNGEAWEVIDSVGLLFGGREGDYIVKLRKEDYWIVFQSVDGFGNMSNKSWLRKN